MGEIYKSSYYTAGVPLTLSDGRLAGVVFASSSAQGLTDFMSEILRVFLLSVLVMMVASRGRAGDVTVRRLGFMILLTIYYGFQSAGINNAAHIGGILGGVLFTLLLYPRGRRRLP